jgi:transposase
MASKLGGIPRTAGGDGAPQKKPTGRPTKLTPELQERICTALRAGNYMETAAAFCGVTKDTLYKWLKKGALPGARGIYRGFSDGVEKAQAEAETRSVALIAKAAATQWQAAAWHLERTKPHRFGRRVLELSGQDGGPMRVALEGGDLLTTLKRLAGESEAAPLPLKADGDDETEGDDD